MSEDKNVEASPTLVLRRRDLGRLGGQDDRLERQLEPRSRGPVHARFSATDPVSGSRPEAGNRESLVRPLQYYGFIGLPVRLNLSPTICFASLYPENK